MPALIPAGLSAFAKTAVGGFLIKTAAAYGLGAAASAIAGNRMDKDNFDTGIKANHSSTTSPLLVVYGERVVGGSLVFQAASGSSNQYLHLILAISEGEVDSLLETYINDEPLTGSKFAPYVRVNFHSGTTGQAADVDTVDEITEWTIDHRLLGVAYAAVRLQYDPDVWTGVPDITFKIRGRKVYDPRTGATAWSDNPALCIRDYLSHPIYGRGIAAASLGDEDFIAEANYYDELVTVLDETGESIQHKRYTCNGVVNTDNPFMDNLSALRTCCRGWVVWSAGIYTLRSDKPDAAQFDFNETNIIGAWQVSPGSKSRIYNRVRCSFFNQDENWEESKTIVASNNFLADDNGVILESDIRLPFTSTITRARILSQFYLKQSRQPITASFTASLEALQVEPGDIVSITHRTPGWNAKLFRVHSMELKYEDVVEIVVGEYDTSVYTFDLETPPAFPDTGLPDPFNAAPPSNLQLASGTDHLMVAGDGTVITRIYASWDSPPSAFVREYELAYKLSSGQGYTVTRSSERQHYITGISDGASVDVRVRSIYASGSKSEWVEVTGYLVIGKTAAPAAPTSFSFASLRDYTREFSWTVNTTDLDAAGYKIRFSTNLTDEWGAMTPLHVGLLTASPWETNLLNAGTYRFAIKTVDTSGNESAIAKYMTATLEDSPVSSILASFYPRLEGWPGTITNGYILPYGDIEATDPTTWDDLATAAPSWDDWTDWAIAGDDLTYQYTDIDLGSELTFRPVITAQVDGAITYQIDFSTDGIAWNGWTTPADDITCRYLRARIIVTGTGPRIQSMSILLDGKKEVEDLSDIDTSTLTGNYRIAVGDIRLPVQTAFNSIKSVQVALQNTGPGWTWELVDKQATYGPRIKIYDNTATLADATIDATVKGY